MNSNWTKSKLNISLYGIFFGLLTVCIDLIPRFGELQPMLVASLLVSAPVYIGCIKPRASLLGVIIIWAGIPLERLVLILLKTNLAKSEDILLKLAEFATVSLLLCFWGLLCSIIARRFSRLEDYQ